MKHGKITDIDCLKKAVKNVGKLQIEKTTQFKRYLESGSNPWRGTCSYAIGRTDGCSYYQVGVVLNEDGSYHLEWGCREQPRVEEKILRGVLRIMAAYEKELAAKEQTYDEEQSELLNKQLETKTHKQTKQRITT